MSDRRRIVSLPTGVGSPTTLLDLENGSTYQAVKDSFAVTPGARKTTMATQPRRYAGARPVAETHDNGTVEWKMLVSGATVTTVVANVEALLTRVESLQGLFLEWRPDGATSSVYYELRGPATWKPTYSWAQMQGAGSMYIDVSFPVAPLGQLDKVAVALTGSGSSPTYYTLNSAIPGDAPALVDVTVTPSTTSQAYWAMIAWMQRPGAPASGYLSPFGTLEAESATSLTTWASAALVGTRGGSYAAVTTAAAGTAQAQFKVDPSVLTADQWHNDTVDVEIWARTLLASGGAPQNLTLTASFWDSTYATNPKQYSREFGSTGTTLPSFAATGGLLSRLGVITMPLSTTVGRAWRLNIDAAWTGVSSSSTWGLDYITLVPARQRACGPTSKALDASYPSFAPSTASGETKTIYSDLSSDPNKAGLGGSPLEFPPGNVDMVLALLNGVPGTASPATGVLNAPTSISLVVTPRVWLAAGT